MVGIVAALGTATTVIGGTIVAFAVDGKISLARIIAR
jgi:hypothetical protein